MSLSKIHNEFYERFRPRTGSQMRNLLEPLQSAKRRAGGIGHPYKSYDDMMAWARARQQQQRQQQQQQETKALPELPRTPPPPASSLQQQQKPSSGMGAPRSNSNSSAVMSSAQEQPKREVVELGDVGVAGVAAEQLQLQQHSVSGKPIFVGLESQGTSKELRLRRAAAAARVQGCRPW